MKKRIITLLIYNFVLLASLQGAENSLPPRQPITPTMKVEYEDRIYVLTPQQFHDYQQTMKEKNEQIKLTTLATLFNSIEKNFPHAIQKTKKLLQEEEEKELQELIRNGMVNAYLSYEDAYELANAYMSCHKTYHNE
jgi:hypothetical protein